MLSPCRPRENPNFIFWFRDTTGQLSIVRDDNAQIRILDPLASRQHAVLHLGKTIEIEDLDSRNGTRLGGEALIPRQRVFFPLEHALLIGNTTLILQHQWVAAKVHTHGHFYDHLVEECARGEGDPQSTFGLMRIHLGANKDPEAVASAISETTRPGDVLASYAPGELELLLPDSSVDKCQEMATQVDQVLALVGKDARLGLAVFPRDGLSPGTLLENACAKVRPGTVKVAGVVVHDPVMRALYQKADLVAKSNSSVFILGETGVGKEVLARTVHAQSRRATKPFIAINCAAFNESLLEDQLFGHERGAFHGVDRARPGLIEAAHGGTFLLDEVGDMPLPMQAKLLRVVDTGEIIRLGSNEVRKVDVRYVAATNRDMAEETSQRRFREDLYHRLAVVELRIPSLWERKAEIDPLARQFLNDLAQAGVRNVPDLSKPAMDLLFGYD